MGCSGEDRGDRYGADGSADKDRERAAHRDPGAERGENPVCAWGGNALQVGEPRGEAGRRSGVPELLLLTDPMAGLEGTSSAIRFDLDVMAFSVVEHNPGVEATAYGLMADFVRVANARPSS